MMMISAILEKKLCLNTLLTVAIVTIVNANCHNSECQLCNFSNRVNLCVGLLSPLRICRKKSISFQQEIIQFLF